MRHFLYNYFDSPLGKIEIRSDDAGVYAIKFISEKDIMPGNREAISAHVSQTTLQIEEYFNGKRKDFDLKLQLRGTDFQNGVWNELAKIPFGETRTYLQLARELGNEKAIRAAASANGKNPFAIVIPCHRVIGSDGSLTGYAGELWRKQWLLEHEAKICGRLQMLF